MRTSWLVLGIVFAALALGCIISVVYKTAKGELKLKSGKFWGAVVFCLVPVFVSYVFLANPWNW